MAFKILSWYPNRELESILASAIEDLPYELIVADENLKGSAKAEWFEAAHPNVVIQFLPVSLSLVDDDYLSESELLVRCLAKYKLPVIQQSSYRVFGESYSVNSLGEDAETSARDDVGRKLNEVEAGFANTDCKILLRTGWLLNAALEGVFAELIPPLAQKRSDLVVSDHHFGSPISKEFLVHAVLAISQQVLCDAQNWGVFHLHSADNCSEAEIADQLVRLFNSDYQLDLQLPTVASKDDSRYHFVGSGNILGQRCTDNFGIQLPTWRKGFKGMVSAWLKRNDEFAYLLENKVPAKKA